MKPGRDIERAFAPRQECPLQNRRLWPLGFLGFLGFVGLTAFRRHEPLLLFNLGFFAFFSYFGYASERLRRPAVLVGAVLGVGGVAVAVLAVAGVITV